MASPVKKDVVLFNDIKKSYPPGEQLEVKYLLVPDSDLKPASRDWIGIFQVGWSSSRDYYTFEWVAELSNDGKGSAMFAGRRLPPEDKNFYQFCYVSSDGHVRGASSPFQFCLVPASGISIDDMELVEVSEDSIMIIQPKEKASSVEGESRQKGSDSSSSVNDQEESLKWKFEMVERENVQKSEMLEQLDVKLVETGKKASDLQERVSELEKKLVEVQKNESDMERLLQAKRDSETRLIEKLEKEKAHSHMLEAARTKEEAESAVLQHRVEELTELVKSLQEKNDKHVWEGGKLKEAMEALNSDLEKSERKTRELQEVQVDLMTQIGERNEEINRLGAQTEEMAQKLESDMAKYQKERDQILQELAIAQENIAELLGAQKETVVVETPAYAARPGPDESSKDKPPTRPAPQDNLVDKSAYEALQLAYENVLGFHQKESDENKKLKDLYHHAMRKVEELEGKVGQYRQRIEKCRQEYEAKAREVIALQKATLTMAASSVSSSEVHDELTALRAQVRDIEESHSQMAKSFDQAIAELAQRKEELKQKSITVAEMDEKIINLEEEIIIQRQEYEDFQDKHDKVLHEKTAKMDKQQSYLDEKVLELTEQRVLMANLQKEKARLDSVVKQLQSQLEALKTTVKTTEERSCPVCDTKFPRRIAQQDFERHVQGHFNAPV